jgi:DNA-binding beta-propeller fold protein YncE
MPLKQIDTWKLSPDVKGHFDHFGVDLKGHRVFVTPEDYKAVLVYDLNNGKLIHKIEGIARPHAVLYRSDLNRIYITDGGEGAVKIYDGTSYNLLQKVKLLEDADSIGYDPVTHYLYVDNGGGDVHETYSMLSVIDTNTGKKLADMKIDGDTLEAMSLESSSPKLYVNNRAKNQVDVIDRQKRTLIASWPVTKGKDNVAMALDEAHHRLFVACRSGAIVVFDTESGKELRTLPISKGVDDLVYDAASQRLYAACDGAVNVFRENGPDDYKSLGNVPSAPAARTARLIPEIDRYFVAVPGGAERPSSILVYEVQ